MTEEEAWAPEDRMEDRSFSLPRFLHRTGSPHSVAAFPATAETTASASGSGRSSPLGDVLLLPALGTILLLARHALGRLWEALSAAFR